MPRPLPLLAICLPFLALAACNTGTKAGDTNVELSAPKKGPSAKIQGTVNGDSLAAGIPRDTSRRPTGKEVYRNSNRAVDRNHDGIAD